MPTAQAEDWGQKNAKAKEAVVAGARIKELHACVNVSVFACMHVCVCVFHMLPKTSLLHSSSPNAGVCHRGCGLDLSLEARAD